MPKFPWTKSKENKEKDTLLGPGSSTSLVPHFSEPARLASPLFERLKSLGKKPKEMVPARHGLGGTEPPASLVPHTSGSTIATTGRLLDPYSRGHLPPSASPSNIDLSSIGGRAPSPLDPAVSPIVAESDKTYSTFPCVSVSSPNQSLNPGDRLPPTSPPSADLSVGSEYPPSTLNSVLSEQGPPATTGHDQAHPTSPHIVVSAPDQDREAPPHGSTSTSAQTSWRNNIVKYSKATLKVLGELTGAPFVGTLIEEMEVSTRALY